LADRRDRKLPKIGRRKWACISSIITHLRRPIFGALNNQVDIAFESCFEDEALENFVIKVAHDKTKTKEKIAYFLELGKELSIPYIKLVGCGREVGS